ncbi:hypothetical protein PTKIN_Ptkin14bG0011800 [Pterospermum kingtungense]
MSFNNPSDGFGESNLLGAGSFRSVYQGTLHDGMEVENVASALEYLHQGHATPIVYCDLKPSNVLLDQDMGAHLRDFDVAKLLSQVDSVIQTVTLATIGA